MLAKLIKYEAKATARVMLPLYGVLLVLALVNRFSFLGSYNSYDYGYGSGDSLFSSLSMMALSFVLIGTFVITQILMIQRFYRNLLTDEGYLMFTLPVKPWQHLTAKLLTSSLWNILSLVMALLSVVILAADGEILSNLLYLLGRAWRQFYLFYGSQGYFYLVESVFAVVINTLYWILTVYAAISIGHLAGRHRLLSSFGAYLLLQLGVSTLSSLTQNLMGFIGYNHWTYFQPDTVQAHLTLLTSCASGLFYSILFFGVTNLILSKRLNLE